MSEYQSTEHFSAECLGGDHHDCRGKFVDAPTRPVFDQEVRLCICICHPSSKVTPSLREEEQASFEQARESMFISVKAQGEKGSDLLSAVFTLGWRAALSVVRNSHRGKH